MDESKCKRKEKSCSYEALLSSEVSAQKWFLLNPTYISSGLLCTCVKSNSLNATKYFEFEYWNKIPEQESELNHSLGIPTKKTPLCIHVCEYKKKMCGRFYKRNVQAN